MRQKSMSKNDPAERTVCCHGNWLVQLRVEYVMNKISNADFLGHRIWLEEEDRNMDNFDCCLGLW